MENLVDVREKEERRKKKGGCTNLAVEINKLVRASNATREACDLRHSLKQTTQIFLFVYLVWTFFPLLIYKLPLLDVPELASSKLISVYQSLLYYIPLSYTRPVSVLLIIILQGSPAEKVQSEFPAPNGLFADVF